MKVSAKLVRYGGVSYNPDSQVLISVEGEPLKLRPKSLKVFLVLAGNSEKVISKEELLAEVWGGLSVTDDSIMQCIAEIRRVLGDSQHKIIKTVPRKGYIFFPPLSQQSQSAQAATLPFFGRVDELATLEDMLKNPLCRLLIVLGLGGVGKSRLSQELQYRLRSMKSYQHGVVLISLASLQHSRLVPSAIATAMGISLQGVRSAEELLIEELSCSEVLIILDNVEHLLPDIGVIQTLIQYCPSLNILLTSRLPTGFEGEWVYHLRGFKLPDTTDNIVQSDAVQLFIDTAIRINYNFKPDQKDYVFIWEICKLLDGLPLGIEIAARWAQHLSCKEILNEIEKNILCLESQCMPDENQTQAFGMVLEQSWEMLTSRERMIMQSLALFRGDFTRQSAAVVAGVQLGDYAGLISKSMICRNPDGRYALHEVMRRYASESRLQSPKKHAVFIQDFFDFHLQIARKVDAEILGGNQLKNIQCLDSEHANFRECLSLCSSEVFRGKLDKSKGLELVGELGMFWFLANHWKEGREWAVSFISSNANTPVMTHAKAFLTAGGLSMLLDDYKVADSYLHHGIELAKNKSSKMVYARGLATSGVLRRLQGRFPEAISCGLHSMALFEDAGDEGGYQFNLGSLGHSLFMDNKYDEAVESLEKCIRINQRIGMTMSMPYALVNLGRLHWRLGQLDDAKLYLKRAIKVSEKTGILLYQAQASCTLGWVEIYSANLIDSLILFQRGAINYLRLGDREGLADTLQGVAVCKAQQGELITALKFITVAEVLIEESEVTVSIWHRGMLKDAMSRIKKGLSSEEQKAHQNLGLATSPEELFRACQ